MCINASFCYVEAEFVFSVLGKGLTLVASVIEGEFNSNKDRAVVAQNAIKEAMKQEKTKGFADVIVAKDVAEGLSYM